MIVIAISCVLIVTAGASAAAQVGLQGGGHQDVAGRSSVRIEEDPSRSSAKIHRSLTFDEQRAEVIILVQEPSGEIAAEAGFLEIVLADLPPERVIDMLRPHSIAARVTRDEALELAASPFVHSIIPNLRLKAHLPDAVVRPTRH